MKRCFSKNLTGLLLFSILTFLSSSLRAQNICQGELALQPDGALGKDALVQSRPDLANDNFGDYPLFAAQGWTWSGTPGVIREYFDFNLSAIPAGATVISATLSLNAWTWGLAGSPCLSGSNEAYVRRVTTPWDENTITWNNQPNVTSSGQKYVPELCAINTNLDIDLTAMVQDMVNNPLNNFGFQFALATEEYYRAMLFHSSDSDEADKRPKLLVKYTYPCPCTAELALQPDGAAGKDALVQSRSDLANDNFGDYPLFASQAWTWNGTPGVIREYFDFNLSAIPAGATVVSATLSLNAWTWGLAGSPCLSGSNEVYVRRVTSPWDENTITWNNQPNVTSSGQKYVPELCAINTNLDIDLTAMVQDMVNNPLNNFGFQFALATEEYYRAMMFHSSDSDEADKRPKLVVKYSYPCPCSGTLALQPDGAAGKDAHVSDWHPAQPGASTAAWLTTAAWTIDGTPVIWHTYMDFDWSALPAGAHIQSATLDLYGVDTGGGDNFTAHSCLSGSNNAFVRRVTSPWDETTMTWNTQPGTTSLNEVAIPALCVPTQNVSLDVTALAQDIIDNPSEGFGFQIRLATEQYYRGLIFGSSDHPDAGKRPKLTLQYVCDSFPTHVDMPFIRNTLNVFPNPTSGNITLEWESPLEEMATLQVLNLQGPLLFEENLSIGMMRHDIDMTRYPAGLYVLSIRFGNGSIWHRKVVKQ